MRQVLEVATRSGPRYRVRYRIDGMQSSETFVRRTDAEMFRDILGNGKNGRLVAALTWLADKQASEQGADVTFGDWFDRYLDNLTGVTERTRADYRSMHRRYFAHFDTLPLTLVTHERITELVNKLDREGRAVKTIKQTIHLISTCLAKAIDAGLLTANPCRGVRLPSMRLVEAEPRFLTYPEASTLLDAMPEHYQPLVAFLLGTGMRWSEATAIEARHVNLDAGTVRVDQAWKRVPGEGMVMGPPKTRKARRTVNAAVMALVPIEPLLGAPRELVFKTRSGGMVSHSNFYNNIWRPACERAGFDPSPRIHDTRHSHASWLISDGISLEAVQDQLGHESIETTRKVYGHLLPAVGVAVGKSASKSMKAVLKAQRGRALPSGG